MNSRLPLHDDRLEGRAALWAARLDGSSFSAADREALDAWLAESPHHRALLAEYCQVSTDLEAQLPALVARGQVAMPPARPARRRFLGVALYAGLTMAAAAIAMLVWTGRTTPVQDIATAVAQRQTVTLADGSRVELNARTTLRADFSGTERRIHLAEGQAFFSVTSDRNRPFVVETPTGSVRVTGTIFDVRTAATSELQVTVVEGSVLVRPGEVGTTSAATPVALRTADQLTVARGTVSRQTLTGDELDDLLAWRKGLIVFNGVPLEAALARFAHHHGRGINVLEGAAAHGVSGRFSLDDLDGFLGMIDQLFPVEVTRQLSGTITVAPRTKP